MQKFSEEGGNGNGSHDGETSSNTVESTGDEFGKSEAEGSGVYTVGASSSSSSNISIDCGHTAGLSSTVGSGEGKGGTISDVKVLSIIVFEGLGEIDGVVNGLSSGTSSTVDASLTLASGNLSSGFSAVINGNSPGSCVGKMTIIAGPC